MGIESPVHILFIAAVALIVLGPKRLPELTRAAGKSIREFREALAETGTRAEGECLPASVGGVADEQPPGPPSAQPDQGAE